MNSQADGNTSHNVPIADGDDHGSQDNASDLEQYTYAECADDTSTGQYVSMEEIDAS